MTYLATFDSEEEAARAWDRVQLWSCKAAGRKTEDVKLNLSLSDYSADEVSKLQGMTQEEVLKKLRRTEERVANQTSKYTGVTQMKKTGRWKSGRWQAQCTIGAKKTYLATFDSEEEAARAWDRMRLWSCNAAGKEKEEVEVELNFSLSDYSDDEVSTLQSCTQEEVIQKLRETATQTRTKEDSDADDDEDDVEEEGEEEEEEAEEEGALEEEAAPGQPQEEMLTLLRRTGKQPKYEYRSNAVERQASPPEPVATAAVKREAADVVPGGAEEPPAGQPPLKKIKLEAVETKQVIAAGGPTLTVEVEVAVDDEVEELTPELVVKLEQDDAREIQLMKDTCGKALKHQRPKPTPPGLNRDDAIAVGLIRDGGEGNGGDGSGGGGSGSGSGSGSGGGGGGGGATFEPAAEDGMNEYVCGYEPCDFVNLNRGGNFGCHRITCGKSKSIFCAVCGGAVHVDSP
jgi:hypothetical protein